MCDEIKDNFIVCGKPVYSHDGTEIIDWRFSCVRLDMIKTIHVDTQKYSRNNMGCVFYTYKDEWYICSTNITVLTEAINNYLGKNKHASSQGSEVAGNCFG